MYSIDVNFKHFGGWIAYEFLATNRNCDVIESCSVYSNVTSSIGTKLLKMFLEAYENYLEGFDIMG